MKNKKSKPINMVINEAEFVGLAGFEEIDSYTIIKESKSNGKIVAKEVQCVDGKILKKKKKKNKNQEQLSKTNNADRNNSSKTTKKLTPSKPNKINQEASTKNTSLTANKENKKSSLKRNRSKSQESSGPRKKLANSVNIEAWKSIYTPDIVIEAIKELGFNEPSSIQKYTIPAAIRAKKDIIGAAETGSGKTLAFIIPIIDGILKQKNRESNDSVNSQENEDLIEENLIKSDEADDSDEFERGSDSGESEEEEECGDGIGCVKVVDNADFDFLPKSGYPNVTSSKLKALIITPTRELAVQIQEHSEAVLSKTDIKCVSVIGGFSYDKQERLLNRNPEIVIGTPGRLWEMFQRGNAHLSQLPNIRFLAIDETDRMLEKGHFEELQNILEIINADPIAKKRRQTFIFSATLTLSHKPPDRQTIKPKLKEITGEMKLENFIKMIGVRNKPKIVDITRKFGTAEMLSEAKIFCDEDEKDNYLYYFLKCFPGRTLIFCNSINCVRRLANLLTVLRCKPQTLHASMQQKQRMTSLERFKSNSVFALIATDVAARGIDIPGVDHIFHYEVPKTAETYVHRSGRTARADREGLSVILIDNQEVGKYRKLCDTLRRSSDLTSFPIDEEILDKARERVKLAREIERTEYGNKMKNKDRNWQKKMAEEAELGLSESDNDDDYICEKALEKRKFDSGQRNRKALLSQLLSRPMAKSNFLASYPTSTGKFVVPEELLVSSSKGALHLVKEGRKNTGKVFPSLKSTTVVKKKHKNKNKFMKK